VQWKSEAAKDTPARPAAPTDAAPAATALERGDDLVQQLSIAKYALAVGDTAQAMDAIDAALSSSRGSLSKLAGTSRPPHNPNYAGSLIRRTAAGAAETN
jgi:hypothetical protein